MPSHDTADRTVHAGFDSIDTGEEISLRDDVLVSIGQSQEMRPGEAKIAVKARQHGFAAFGRGHLADGNAIEIDGQRGLRRNAVADQEEFAAQLGTLNDCCTNEDMAMQLVRG